MRSITPKHSPATPTGELAMPPSAGAWLVDASGKSAWTSREPPDALSLERLVRTLGRVNRVLPCALGTFVVHEVAAALAHLQRSNQAAGPHGTLHGDLRPREILIFHDGSVRLLAFDEGNTRTPKPCFRRSSRGTLSFVSYRAPEQILGLPVDGRADVFTLGALLWELLVGPALFRGRSEEHAEAAVLAHEVPRPSSLRADVPRSLDEIAVRALAHDRRQRFPNAEALAVALAVGLPPRAKLLKYGATWVTNLLGPTAARTPLYTANPDDSLTLVRTPTPHAYAAKERGSLPRKITPADGARARRTLPLGFLEEEETPTPVLPTAPSRATAPPAGPRRATAELTSPPPLPRRAPPAPPAPRLPTTIAKDHQQEEEHEEVKTLVDETPAPSCPIPPPLPMPAQIKAAAVATDAPATPMTAPVAPTPPTVPPATASEKPAMPSTAPPALKLLPKPPVLGRRPTVVVPLPRPRTRDIPPPGAADAYTPTSFVTKRPDLPLAPSSWLEDITPTERVMLSPPPPVSPPARPTREIPRRGVRVVELAAVALLAFGSGMLFQRAQWRATQVAAPSLALSRPAPGAAVAPLPPPSIPAPPAAPAPAPPVPAVPTVTTPTFVVQAAVKKTPKKRILRRRAAPRPTYARR